MVFATKERITAHRLFSTRRYILSTHPVLYISGRRDFQGTNQFLSDDAYGYLCTRTGALWILQGYSFDGLDDKIDCGSPATLDNLFDAGGTVIVWANASNVANNIVMCSKLAANAGWEFGISSPVGNNALFEVYHYWSGTDGYWQTSSKVFSRSVWHCVGFTYNSSATTNNAILYKNGVSQAISTTSPTGTRDSDAANAFTIGGLPGGTKMWEGTIGEVFAYNRILTALEIQQIYQVTRWRY